MFAAEARLSRVGSASVGFKRPLEERATPVEEMRSPLKARGGLPEPFVRRPSLMLDVPERPAFDSRSLPPLMLDVPERPAFDSRSLPPLVLDSRALDCLELATSPVVLAGSPPPFGSYGNAKLVVPDDKKGYPPSAWQMPSEEFAGPSSLAPISVRLGAELFVKRSPVSFFVWSGFVWVSVVFLKGLSSLS